MNSQTERHVSSKPTERRGNRRRSRSQVELNPQCAAFPENLQMDGSTRFSQLHAKQSHISSVLLCFFHNKPKGHPLKMLSPADFILPLLFLGAWRVRMPWGVCCIEWVYCGPAHVCVDNPLVLVWRGSPRTPCYVLTREWGLLNPPPQTGWQACSSNSQSPCGRGTGHFVPLSLMNIPQSSDSWKVWLE